MAAGRTVRTRSVCTSTRIEAAPGWSTVVVARLPIGKAAAGSRCRADARLTDFLLVRGAVRGARCWHLLVADTDHQLPTHFDPATRVLHDAAPDVGAVGPAGGKDQSDRSFEDEWPLGSWPDMATQVFTSDNDRFFPAEFQRRVALDRLGTEPETLPGGHLVAHSRPLESGPGFDCPGRDRRRPLLQHDRAR